MKRLGFAQARTGSSLSIPVWELSSKLVFFVGDLDVCWDGSGPNTKHDKTFQPDTFYHDNGRALDATKVPYIVVPKLIIEKTQGIVMGCWGKVTRLSTGKSFEGVVGDYGGLYRVGEVSVYGAQLLGVDDDPNTGGDDALDYAYEIKPGVEASRPDASLYHLQAWKS